MSRLSLVALLLVGFALRARVALAQTPTPPPTPTLAPVEFAGPSATQTLQIQDFARRSAYLAEQSVIVGTTQSGAVWVVERRFTYGEIMVTVVLLFLFAERIFEWVFNLVRRRAA